MSELTEQEQKFFETGELPEGLADDSAKPTDPAPITPAPTASPEQEAAAAPADDQLTALRAELARQTQINEAIVGRLGQLQEQFARATTPQSKIPDAETDPLGKIIHSTDDVSQRLAGLEKQLQQNQVAQAEAAQLQGFVSRVVGLKEDFMKATPDYQMAYDHLRKVKADELRLTGTPRSEERRVGKECRL